MHLSDVVKQESRLGGQSDTLFLGDSFPAGMSASL